MKLRSLILSLALGGAALAGSAAEAVIAPSDSLATAVGTQLGGMIRESLDGMARLGVPVDNKVFLATLAKVLDGQPTGFTAESADAWLDAFIRATRPDELPEKFTPESQAAFVALAAAQKGAVTTPSGLVIITEKEGSGAHPALSDKATFKYVGRFSDGTIFDATSAPMTVGVTELMPGFTEALQLMRPGGRYRIVIPAHLAYGEEGISGAVPGNAALDFDVEFIGSEGGK